MTAGSGPLKIVAAENRGSLDTIVSSPAIIHWKSHYSWPSLPLGILLAALLILPARNRRWQAWLILVPLALVATPLQALNVLLPAPSATVDSIAFFLTTLGTALAVVWLVGPWLSRRHPAAALLLGTTVMMATGALSCVSFYGMPFAGEMTPPLALHAVCVLCLLLAMTLTARSCRKDYRPGRFLLLLMMWMVPSVAAAACVFIAPMVVIAGDPSMMLLFLLGMVVYSLIGSVMMYLVNLPFMLLAFYCPFYRQRFQDAFRLQEQGNSPFAPVVQPAGSICVETPEPLPAQIVE